MKTKLVFIVGMPRSGTTWLWGLLTSHPDVVPITLKDFGIDKESSESAAFLHHSEEEAIRVIQKKIDENPDKVILEKTPEHLSVLKKIKKNFPNCMIICIRRDIRDVIASILHSKFKTGFKFANGFYHAVVRCMLWQKQIKSPLIDRFVYYEDLNTTQYLFSNLKVIFNMLELKYSTKDVNRYIKENKGKVKTNQEGLFRKGKVGSYKEDLTPEQIDIINKIFDYE